METQFQSTLGIFTLKRYPIVKNQNLRAWDAADEYLIEFLHPLILNKSLNNTFIFNDAFGCLSLALNKFNPTISTDSYISQRSIQENMMINDLDLNSINIINSLDLPNCRIDTLIIKIPKSLDYLKFFLDQIRPFLNNSCKIYAAAMVKNMPSSVWKIFESTYGPTSTTLAKKKAKIIEIQLEQNDTISNYPSYFLQEKTNYKIYNHANVFSKQSLDIGTRFLLDHLPHLKGINSIVDLGCGNGVVGLNLAKNHPEAKVIFTDESYMAIESARLTLTENSEPEEKHEFNVTNCLDGIDDNSVDLIVCNPPFHQSHSIGLHIALQMIRQSHYKLKTTGKLIVIANRHLPYYSHLKNIFRKLSTIASNKKFNIYQASK